MPPETHRRPHTLAEAWRASGGPMTMNQHDDTQSPLTADQRIRRLRALLAMLIDRYGDEGPIVATIRRNLTRADARRVDPSAGHRGRVPR